MPIQGDTSNRYGDQIPDVGGLPQPSPGEEPDSNPPPMDGWHQRLGSLQSWLEAKAREQDLHQATLDAFGDDWMFSFDYLRDVTNDMADVLSEHQWTDVMPDNVDAHECRIGLSKFFVPPISINVNQVYKAGALHQGALRQQSPPKTNTGHRETVIQMTLYFPTYESIWGVEDDVLNVRFDRGGDTPGTSRPMDSWDTRSQRTISSEPEIDRFMSTLRGLIAQFKYAPFLPIKNAYINQVFGITGVTLKDITLSTVPNFPMCMAVHLTMYKFNHKVYLPMIQDFDQAIHWGRYREYCGRAIGALARASTPIRTWKEGDTIRNSDIDVGEMVPIVRPTADVVRENNPSRINSTQTFHRHTPMEIADFELYFPLHTPQRVDVPSTAFIEDTTVDYQPGHRDINESRWIDIMENNFGFRIDRYPEARFDAVRGASEGQGQIYVTAGSHRRLLSQFLEENSIGFEQMTPARLNRAIGSFIQEHNIGTEGHEEVIHSFRGAWFRFIYLHMLESPYLAHTLAMQASRERRLTINEWELPMFALGMDMNYVSINGVSVTLGNNISRLQLQMEDEPTHQHVGGMDSRVDISLIFHGEKGKEQLMKLRMMFDNVSDLARLEQGHGVLGFLGIKSSISALAGIRYVLPLNFEVNTIPNYPNTFEVNLSFTDFDIFQQKKEQPSVAMQARMAQELGKRNPFLRIKQMFGIHNAYPDFPLSIHGKDSDDVIGFLDPDYYFRSFKIIDDDIINIHKNIETRPDIPFIEQVPQGSFHDESVSHDVEGGVQVHNEIKSAIDFILPQLEGNTPAMSIDYDGGCIPTTNGRPVMEDGSLKVIDCDVAAGQQGRPYVEGLIPGSAWNNPYLDNGADPSTQFYAMAKDMQYRDNSGRMIRAFPTYMMWIIDEAGSAFGVNLMDNIYGLQSVIDLSIVRSEDVMTDTMVLRLSNVYSKLTTKAFDYLNESGTEDATSRIINRMMTRHHRIMTGMSNDYVADLDTFQLRPGLRVHLRMGYGANPGKLETVFNGTITEVEEGSVLTVVAQSDAMELGAYVETDNEKGHSGRIDGSFGGLYLSEPRDLMVNLLSQGASRTREFIALATRGDVHSENRYGIKHFGNVLYTYMDGEEYDDTRQRQNTVLTALISRQDMLEQAAEDFIGDLETEEDVDSRRAGQIWTNTGNDIPKALWELISMGFANLASRRDYEVFKRNIYPGNGIGIGQYLGGDIGDIGLGNLINQKSAEEAEDYELVTHMGITPDGEAEAPESLMMEQVNPTQLIEIASGRYAEEDEIEYEPLPAASSGVLDGEVQQNTGRMRNIWRILGFSKGDVDNDGPFDEVAFRASTYMKTVWDMFETCAGLLPDYIVAVRPFEDRSTVFYGKPHWLYTSSLIPVTTGPSSNTVMPQIVQPDEELRQIMDQIQLQMAQDDGQIAFERFVNEVSLWEGTRTTAPFSGPGTLASGDINDLGGGIAEVGSGGTDEPMDGWHAAMVADGTISDETSTSIPTGTEDASSGGSMYNNPANRRSWVTWEELMRAFSQEVPLQDANAYRDRVRIRPSNLFPNIVGRNNVLNKPRADTVMSVYFEGIQVGGNQGAGVTEEVGVAHPEGIRLYEGVQWDVDWQYFVATRAFLEGSGIREQGVDEAVGDTDTTDPEDILGSGSFQDSVHDIMENVYDWEDYFSDAHPIWLEAFVAIVDEVKTAQQAKAILDQFHGADEMAPKAYGTGLGMDRPAEDPDSLDPELAAALPDADRPQHSRDIVERETDSGSGFDPNFDVEAAIQDMPYGSTSNMVNPEDLSAAQLVMLHDGLLHTSSFGNWIGGGTGGLENADGAATTSFPSFRQDYHTLNAFFASRYLAELSTQEKLEIYAEVYDSVIEQFMEWVDNNPYVSGWLVRTASSERVRVWQIQQGARIWQHYWSYEHMYTVFQLFCGYGSGAAEEYMAANWGAGRRGSGFWSSAWATMIDRDWGWQDEMAGGWGGALGALLANTVAGMTQMIRATMMTMTQGMAMSTDIQARTNILNRTLNDSIYYSRGRNPRTGAVEHTLLNYVDNPFTREYGEPVVEVREPFERIHTLSSFQHIINNRVVESIDDVPTVITAHSNDGDPVTVYLDKGMPSERQVERTIDTGLYWDQPTGWLGLEGIIKPISATRHYIRSSFRGRASDGVPSEISAKRVALYHLKKGLEKLYRGEITTIGDATIRPHDSVYLFDIYTRMYGFFKVRQVVHHFTPEMGFITQITPGLKVSINDPARWSVQARWRGTLAEHTIRETARRQFQLFADHAAEANEIQNDMTTEQLVEMFSDQIQGSLQYTSGMGSFITNQMSQAAGGSARWGNRMTSIGTGANFPVLGGLWDLFFGAERGMVWAPYRWYRDNLLDQQGCTVDFLTKNGSPMDGNLSYAEGIAVGQPRVNNIIVGGLRIATIPRQEESNGSLTRIIQTTDIMPNLAWDETNGLNEQMKGISLFHDESLSKVSQMAYSEIMVSNFESTVYWVRVTRVIDADTFEVSAVGGPFTGSGGPPSTLRLFGADAVEDDYKTSQGTSQSDRNAAFMAGDLGVIATEWVKGLFFGDNGVKTGAVRIPNVSAEDQYDRNLGYFYYNAPNGLDEQARKDYLLNAAGTPPVKPWDSYTSDGRPHTLDWELVLKGYAHVYSNDLREVQPGRGA